MYIKTLNSNKDHIMRLSLVGSATVLAALLVGCKVFDTPAFQKNYSLYNREAGKAERENNWDAAATVSYTHLTLPTICSV